MSQISRRTFLTRGALGIAGIHLTSAFACQNRKAPRPNFVFFLTDDQRWDGMSCAGNSILNTPHMDRIASEGIRFENMFVTSSLCGPSRATYLTGKYAHSHGVRRNSMTLGQRQITFPEILKSAGYETAFVGKWHNTDMGKDRGFDYYFGFKGQGEYLNPLISENHGPEQQYSGHITDILTDKAVQFIARDHERPFCLLLWFKAPHRSFRPAERFKNLYQDIHIPLPENYSDDYRGKPQAVKNANMKIGDFPDIPEYQTFVKDYYRCLAGVDENVGRVLQALEIRGLKEDTAVVYAGDNGFFIGEHHFFDKRFMYEESIRVPLLIRYPQAYSAGQVRNEMAINTDIAPTLLDLAGISPPPDMQGQSLKPLLQGRVIDWREDFLYEYYEYPGAHSGRMNRGIRTRKWKYIHFFEEPQEIELYNLEKDPQEMVNLAHVPEYTDIRESLSRRLLDLRQTLNDPDW